MESPLTKSSIFNKGNYWVVDGSYSKEALNFYKKYDSQGEDYLIMIPKEDVIAIEMKPAVFYKNKNGGRILDIYINVEHFNFKNYGKRRKNTK